MIQMDEMLTLSEARAAETAEHFAEHGYALVREFISGDLLAELQAETRRMYDESLKHHATCRHENLAFEILPESDFDQRYVIQVYWMS